MILVDANIILYAEDQTSSRHAAARQWWDTQLSGSGPVCLAWAVINAFVRISTNHRIFSQPLDVAEAVERVHSWLKQPCVRVVVPTTNHWTTLKKLLVASQATGNLVADAHLAAIAIDHGCRLLSCDHDFSRFRGLNWKNPLP